jgi:dienelactone hydrolase
MISILAASILGSLAAPGEAPAQPATLADAAARLAAKAVLREGEADRRLRDAVLRRLRPVEIPPREVWEERAREVRERVLGEVVLRGVPREVQGGGPRVEEAGTIETGKGYRIRKIRYEAWPGLRIPALLYEPDPPPQDGEKIAAVLNPNGHVGPLGKARPEEQIRCINLAKRGILALKPEWYACGELSGPGYGHEKIAGVDLCGTSGVGLFYLALSRALDVLVARPGVDPARVAVTGLSGGGWQTIVIAALDTRVKAMAPNAGFSGLELRVDHAGSIGDPEQNPPDLAAIADYPLLTAAFAPRPVLLIYNARDDCCFPAARAKASVFDPVAPLYARLYPGAEFSYHENRDPGTHNYDRDNREALYRFLARHGYPRGPAPESEIPCDGEVLDFEALRVGLPGPNADFRSIALDLAQGLPETSWPRPAGGEAAAPAAEIGAWRDRGAARLREVLRIPAVKVIEAREAWTVRSEGIEARAFALDLDDGSRVPAVELSRAPAGDPASADGGRPRGADVPVVAFADRGRAAAVPEIAEVLAGGRTVILIDPALVGENRPRGNEPWQHAMMLDAAGVRPLGLQVSQIIAAVRWAAERSGGTTGVAILGSGPTSSAAALAATALDPRVTGVAAVGLVPSLKILIDGGPPYHEAPGLYAFGLLRAFDVKEMAALCAPRPVCVLRPAGGEERWEAESKDLPAVFRALGGPPPGRDLRAALGSD